jgi:glycosyltransferase involved in cell wall biosynthesis
MKNTATAATSDHFRPLRICIVSHNGYGAISGGKHGFIGGVEWQTSLLARWLHGRGHHVTFLTWDEGGGPEEMIDGIRVIKICGRDEGVRGIRFFHPKWTGLVSAMKKADSDVYYHNCGECVTGQIALWCMLNDRAFVFTAANDTDCDPELPEFKHFKDRALYRLGLRKADRIIVQTESQQKMLERGLGLHSSVIPMPCQRHPHSPTEGRRMIQSNRVLWIARVCPQKRPDRLVAIAKQCPDLEFDIVGPHYQDPLSRKALADAQLLQNLTIHGPLSREQVRMLLPKAACLLCTSDYEGFPNTFLEAWSHALPVVSTFDPDHVISRHKLGLVAHGVTELAHAIRELIASVDLYRECSTNALTYFLTHHDAERVQPHFERMINEAAALHRISGFSRAMRTESPQNY